MASLAQGRPSGCRRMEGPPLRPVLVDQSPIGANPRSNPATYTGLADLIRDGFAAATGLSPSHFSFNRPEGACPACHGMGAIEVQMRYLPSTWIPCAACGGLRFSEEVLAAEVDFGRRLSIADLYELSIAEATPLLLGTPWLPAPARPVACAHPGGAGRCRPGLPLARPAVAHSVGRRGAARQAGQVPGPALADRPPAGARRAFDRAAPTGPGRTAGRPGPAGARPAPRSSSSSTTRTSSGPRIGSWTWVRAPGQTAGACCSPGRRKGLPKPARQPPRHCGRRLRSGLALVSRVRGRLPAQRRRSRFAAPAHTTCGTSR